MDDLMRRVDLTINYLGREISDEINMYVSSVETIDNYEGIIDSLRIEFSNKDNIFLKPNFAFKVGERIKIGCRTLNWEGIEGPKNYFFGEYMVDERIIQKNKLIIKGLSIPLEAKDTVYSRTWPEITMENLAKEFADKYSLQLNYMVKEKISLSKLSQQKVTDFSFLKKIAEDENIMIKIAKDKLILFEDGELIKAKEIITLDLNKVINYSFKETSNAIYDSVEIQNFDTVKFKKNKQTITIEELRGGNPGAGAKPLKINTEYKNKTKNFKIYALKKLEFVNKKNKVIEIEIIGKAGIYSGQVLNIVNSGILNGKYMMVKVKQGLPGFTTKITGYKL